MNRLQVRGPSKSPSPLVSQWRFDSSYVNSSSRESAASRKIHDGGPDGRRQAVPVRDELPKCRVSADMVQPLAPMLDASVMRRNDLRNSGRGCNSRVPLEIGLADGPVFILHSRREC